MNTRFKMNTGSMIANSDPTQGEHNPIWNLTKKPNLLEC